MDGTGIGLHVTQQLVHLMGGRIAFPDIIVLDIDLPDMNRFEVVKILKAAPSTMDIPETTLSAAAMPSGMDAS